jgi:uncharacterized protein (TIGR02001 family)
MNKYLAKTALAASAALMTGNVLAQAAPANAEPVAVDPGPITANVTLASEYRYRGIAQTNSKPAIQGGFDYAHESGFYIGNWNSNISWISDFNAGVSAPIEMDFYAGYKKEVSTGLTLDGGLLQYYYPTSAAVTATKNPNTLEGYAGLTYEFVTLKYSYSFTNLFGWADSKGSQYIDLSANYDTGFEGIILNGHVGYQKVANNSIASYTDWKLGLTKDFGKGLAGSIAYIGTNADGAAYYNPALKNTGRGTAFISLTKTF